MGIGLDVFERDQAQAKASVSLDAMAAEAIVKSAPGQRRRCQQKQGRQGHDPAQAAQRITRDHTHLDRGDTAKTDDHSSDP